MRSRVLHQCTHVEFLSKTRLVKSAGRLAEAKGAFGELFPVQKPRHVVVGIWSGIRCVVSGVLVGLRKFTRQLTYSKLV